MKTIITKSLILPGILGIILLYQTMPRLFEEWQINSNTSHVILTLPISLFLLFKTIKNNLAENLSGQSSSIPITAIIFFAVSLILLTFDALIVEESFLAIALFLGITGILKISLNKKGFRNCFFPMGLLAFNIPLPETLARHVFHMHLQKISAITSAGLLSLTGYNAKVTGSVIFINDIRINVVEACSGLNAVISFTFLSLIICHILFKKNMLFKIITVSGAIIAAIISNVFRLYTAGIIADNYGIKKMYSFIHSGSVTIIYIVGMVFLFLLTTLLREIDNARTVSPYGEISGDNNE